MVKETPLVKQYQEIKSKYPDTFLFFRLGDFYELFGDDAIEASKLMEITLTKRRDMPMCGIPYHSTANYIKKLLNKSRSVAICEQVEDPSQSKGIVKREVVRVITPGTVIEDELLAGDTNNFLSAVFKDSNNTGIVFLDISTGDFFGTYVEDKRKLESELSRHPVKEVIVPSDSDKLKSFFKIKFPSLKIQEKDSWYFNQEKAADLIKNYFSIATLKGWDIDKHPSIVSACGGLVEYLKETQKQHKIQVKKFHLYTDTETMIIDSNSQDNLELIRNLQDGSKKNTLFEVLDFTDTSMGRRKLVQYISRPLRNISKIRKRLNGVEELMENSELVKKITAIISNVSDMERIISKAVYGSCNARDLLSLKESLKSIPNIKNLLDKTNSKILKNISGELKELDKIVNELEKSIKDSPPLTVKEGDIIKKGYNSDLDELIEISAGDKRWISSLEKKEKDRLKIPTLKVGYNKVYGYYIEITKTHSEKVPAEYERKQTLVNSERYVTQELKEREDSILGAEERRKELEYSIFNKLRKMVSSYSEEIQNNARNISILDVLNSFAKAARKYSYCKPHVGDWDKIEIRDGRHPVIERNMSINEFIPNDSKLDSGENQILIITGPNMAGKSTYLKQVAIINIMAQMGSFVPAKKAIIGIADRVFTRIGAGENLAGGESTFMVEMTEVASILNNATRKSLVILDEVGRGTSTFDGISIAWSVIEEISNVGAKTLFATHYFELTELSSYMNKVKNYNFAVREWRDKKKIVFLRKLQKGSADKSYGIHCAELAGVPKKVISRAWNILKKLEQDEFDNMGQPKMLSNEEMSSQLNLFTSTSKDEYKEKIKEIELEKMTPLDVVNKIKEWQIKIKNEN
ncbi:MAG: DNA mismatch repair protein MutS [Elusimicrobiota bacterium]